MTSLDTTISNSFLIAGRFLTLSGVVWFFVSCLVGNRPPISATPPACLPRTIYVPLASPHPYTLTTVISVSSLSQTTALQLLIKTCPHRIALIWLWPMRLFLSYALLFPPLVISLVWRNPLWYPASRFRTWVSFLTLKIRFLFYYLAKRKFLFLSFSNKPFSRNPRPGYSTKSWWKMYFDGSGCFRSEALYK